MSTMFSSSHSERAPSFALSPAGVRPTPTFASKLAWRLLLVVWAAGLLTICAYLLGSHLLALPVPGAGNPKLAAAVADLREDRDDDWFVVHVLYTRCACSEGVFDHLLEDARPDDLAEMVLLVGDDPLWTKVARTQGLRVTQISHDDLESRFDIEAAPLLLVADPGGTLRYVGGYTDRKQGPNIRDLQIIADLRANAEVGTLPAFGCAVSAALRALRDPLQLL